MYSTEDNGSFDDSVVVVFAALWILNPKINDDVPIKKETIVRIFPTIAGIITIGNPWLVYGCCCNVDEKQEKPQNYYLKKFQRPVKFHGKEYWK